MIETQLQNTDKQLQFWKSKFNQGKERTKLKLNEGKQKLKTVIRNAPNQYK